VFEAWAAPREGKKRWVHFRSFALPTPPTDDNGGDDDADGGGGGGGGARGWLTAEDAELFHEGRGLFVFFPPPPDDAAAA